MQAVIFSSQGSDWLCNPHLRNQTIDFLQTQSNQNSKITSSSDELKIKIIGFLLSVRKPVSVVYFSKLFNLNSAELTDISNELMELNYINVFKSDNGTTFYEVTDKGKQYYFGDKSII